MLPFSPCPRCGAALSSAGAMLCAACALEAALEVEEMPDAAPASGQFGEYDLLSVIARGGMGVVYLARQRAAGRMVALKMIASPLLAGETQFRRFRAEAEAVAGLEHPHIVPLYDVGEVDGQLFFTMRLMEGGTLADLMQRKPCMGHAPLFSKVARAIHHAHERGVLHRDLKPANILLDVAGEPGVADFGLALRADAGTRLTVSGAAMGTPDYMAPEQASGKSSHATIAADIYSLGAMLYEGLTGRPPFASPTPLETMRRALSEEAPRPSSLRPAVDRDLETIALCCLEKVPARRYATAAALADDLDRQQRGEPIHARPVGTIERMVKWTRRRPALAALLALALIVPAASAWFFAVYRARVESQARAASLAAQERYAVNIAQTSRAIEAGQLQLAYRLLDDCRPAPGEADLRGFEWHHLRRCAAGDDERILLAPGPDGHRAQRARFHPQDHRIAITDSDGGVTLTSADPAIPALRWQAHRGAAIYLAFSPDGTRLLTASPEEKSARLWVVPAAAGPAPEKPLREFAGRAVHVAFAPQGSQFVIGLEENDVRRLDLYESPSAAPLPLPLSAQYGWWSRDGARFYAHDVQGWGKPAPLTVLVAATWQPVPGPDGKPLRIAEFGHWDSFTLSADGSLAANVINGVNIGAWHTAASSTADSRPAWQATPPPPSVRAGCVKFLPPRQGTPELSGISPDPSLELLAAGTAHGAIHFYNTENWLEAFALRGHDGELYSLDFSADGRFMVTTSADGTARLWRPQRREDLSQRLTLTNGPLCLSADGRAIGGLVHGSVAQWNPADGKTSAAPAKLTFTENHECLRSQRSSVDGTWSLVRAPQSAGGCIARLLHEPDAAAQWEKLQALIQAQCAAGATSCIPSTDGLTMIFGYRDGSIALHDALTGDERTRLRGNLQPVCRLDLSPDATWLAASDHDGHVDFRQNTGGAWRLVHSLDAGGYTAQVVFSAGNTLAVVSGGAPPLAGLLIQLPAGERTALRGPGFDHAALSPDGLTLATANDKKVSLWQIPSGRFLTELPGSGGGNVQFLHFTAGGHTLVHGSQPGFQIWRAGE